MFTLGDTIIMVMEPENLIGFCFGLNEFTANIRPKIEIVRIYVIQIVLYS